MNLDVLLPVLQIVVPLLIAGIGYEMSHNPPQTRLAKNSYRAAFVVWLVAVIGIAIWQAQRTAAQQLAARRASDEAVKRSERDLTYVRGQLAEMGRLLVNVVATIAERKPDRPLVASTTKGSVSPIATVPITTVPISPDKPLVASTTKASEPPTVVPVAPPPPPAPTAAMLAEATEPSKTKPSRCDINGDGKIDVRDIQEVTNQVLGNMPRTPAGDINGDGFYNALDVQAVINAAVGGGCPYQ